MADVRGKSVFLSGPMTGIDHYNCEGFARVHALVKEAGATLVYNPSVSWLYERAEDSEDKTHEEYMCECLSELTRCSGPYDRKDGRRRLYDAILMLPGWEASAGAKMEREVAKAIGMEVIEWWEVE